MDKEIVIYTSDGILFSYKKRMKSFHLLTTWMDLKSITPSEISQREKDKYHIMSLISGT